MPPRSKISHLPREIRDELGRLVRDGRYTIAQIRDHLRQLGAEVSWSGVQREVSKEQAALEKYRAVQDIARTWTEPLGEGAGSDIVQLLINMLQPIIYRHLQEMQDPAKATDSKSLGQLTRVMRDLVGAVSNHTKSRVYERDVVRSKVIADATEAVDRVAKQQGISADTVAQLKAEFLGIR